VRSNRWPHEALEIAADLHARVHAIVIGHSDVVHEAADTPRMKTSSPRRSPGRGLVRQSHVEDVFARRTSAANVR